MRSFSTTGAPRRAAAASVAVIDDPRAAGRASARRARPSVQARSARWTCTACARRLRRARRSPTAGRAGAPPYYCQHGEDRGRRELRRRPDGRARARAGSGGDGDRPLVPHRSRRQGLEPGCRRGAARRAVDFLTALGDDAFGADARALWRTEGVAAEAVVAAAATMTAPILVEPTGVNRIVVVPGALAELSPRTSTRSPTGSRPPTSASSSSRSPSRPRSTRSRWRGAAGVTTILNPAPAPAEPIAPHVRLRDAERDARPRRRAAPAATFVSRSATREPRSTASASRPFLRRSSTRPAPATPSPRPSRSRSPRGSTRHEAVRWGCAAGAHMVEHQGVVPGLPTREQLESETVIDCRV